jgi:mono/diheme cytochrome c family protein
MILSISFAFFVVLGMMVYVLNDNRRADTTLGNVIAKEAEAGAELFAANCSQCHGPRGEGAIGPALDRPEWHAGDPKYDENAVTTFLHNVLQRGQHSPQPGINMPAWSKEYGGPFNDQELEDVVSFITHGSWENPQILAHTAAPNYLADIPANSVQKNQYPTNLTELVAAADPARYGNGRPNDAQKKLLDEAVKAETANKGPLYQQVLKNQEALRLILGNRDPNKPGESLNGIKQLLQLKGCIGCHGFGSAGTTLGPNLTEVGSRREREWLYNWIKDPSKVPGDNRGPNVQPWFSEENRTVFWPMQPTYMPTIKMTDEERNRIVDYLKDLKTAPVAAPAAPAQGGS